MHFFKRQTTEDSKAFQQRFGHQSNHVIQQYKRLKIWLTWNEVLRKYSESDRLNTIGDIQLLLGPQKIHFIYTQYKELNDSKNENKIKGEIVGYHSALSTDNILQYFSRRISDTKSITNQLETGLLAHFSRKTRITSQIMTSISEALPVYKLGGVLFAEGLQVVRDNPALHNLPPFDDDLLPCFNIISGLSLV